MVLFYCSYEAHYNWTCTFTCIKLYFLSTSYLPFKFKSRYHENHSKVPHKYFVNTNSVRNGEYQEIHIRVEITFWDFFMVFLK